MKAGQQARQAAEQRIIALALRQHHAMPDDGGALAIPFDPPDPDVVLEHCLAKCRRGGVEPVARERADGLIQERTATIAASLSVRPTMH